MTNHKSVLVPLEAWTYSSLGLKIAGKSIDIGLFAEALLYYDCVIVNPTNQPQFAEFIRWFRNRSSLSECSGSKN